MSMRIIEDCVASVLNRPIPDNRGRRCYLELPKYLDRERVNGLSHIVFIAYYPDPHLLKKALVLRSSGKVLLTLLAGCIREDVAIEDYFDQYYEYDNFRDLYEIVSRSHPHSWHAVSPIYHAAIVICGCPGRRRLVVDIVDPALFLATARKDPTVELEAAVLNAADHIVHKLPEPAWITLRDAYDLQCWGSTVLNYPHSRFSRRTERRNPQTLPHVVYAGGIVPYEIALTRGHGNHVFDDLIQLTAADTFELSIYVNQNAREMPWHQHEHYFDLQETHKHFHFERGLPYDSVTQALSRFDAGIFFDNVRLSSYNPAHFEFNISSKFFTYLEAGLPVVVYEEAEAMADLVRSFGLGTTYRAQELHTIVPAVREIVGNDYLGGIEAFRREFSMESYAQTLLEVHDL